MTLADIQNQINNQIAKIEEQQQALLDSQNQLSLLLEKKKIMQQLAHEKLKKAIQILKEAQADLEYTTEEIIDITKSEMINPEAEVELDLQKYHNNSLILGSIEIDLQDSELTVEEGKKELANAITEKIDDFEFALSRLPPAERDCARLKLQSVIGNFVNK